MSAKKEKKSSKTYIIPPKEMIVTRNKSAQLRREQHSVTESNTEQKHSAKTLSESKPKKKDQKRKAKNNRKCEEEMTEYYPEKPKRNKQSSKIILKPKHELKTVVTLEEFKKRKPILPKKKYQLVNTADDMFLNDVVEHEDESKTVSPQNNDKPKNVIPAEDLKKLSIPEIIVLDSESGELTEDDLMEIITCPSPVWWEDPPDDSYIEDPIMRSVSAASHVTERRTEDLDIISIATTSTESDCGSVPTRTTPESNKTDSISRKEERKPDIYPIVRSESAASHVTERRTEDLDIISVATTSTESDCGSILTRATPKSNKADSISRKEEREPDIYPIVRSESAASHVTERRTEDLDIISVATTSTESDCGSIPTRATPEPNKADSISRKEEREPDIYGHSLTRDRTFLDKRNALENLLSGLKQRVSVKRVVKEKEKIDVEPETIDKMRKDRTPEKVNHTDILPQVPLDVLNDLENFEIPMAKSAKRNNDRSEMSECIVINDDDDDDVDVGTEQASKDIEDLVLDVGVYKAPRDNVKFAELVEKIKAQIENAVESRGSDDTGDSSKPNTQSSETNTDAKESRVSTESKTVSLKTDTDANKTTNVTEQSNENPVGNGKPSNANNVKGSVRKNMNCKIFIKKNATVKPNTILGIPHSVLGNIVIPHSKELQSSTKKLLLPLRRVYLNSISQNHCAPGSSPPKTSTAGDLSELKSVISNSVQNGNSRSVDDSAETEHRKKKHEYNDSQPTPQTKASDTPDQSEVLEGNSKEPTKRDRRKQELTCDLDAEIQVVDGDDLQTSTNESSRMVKDAYIKFLKSDSKAMRLEKRSLIQNKGQVAGTCQYMLQSDKAIRIEKGSLVQNEERVAETRRHTPLERPQLTCEHPEIEETSKCDKSPDESVKFRLVKAVPSNNMTKVNGNSLLDTIKTVKANNINSLVIPLKISKNAKIKDFWSTKSDLKRSRENPILKTILDGKLDDFMGKAESNPGREVAESENGRNRKRLHPIMVKPNLKRRNHGENLTTLADVHTTKVADTASRKNGEALKICTSTSGLKVQAIVELVECESCNIRCKPIAVSKKNTVKYCYKCSSIFNTTNCDYCLKGGDGSELKRPYLCNKCSDSCCCLQSLEKHLKSHAVKRDSETPG